MSADSEEDPMRRQGSFFRFIPAEPAQMERLRSLLRGYTARGRSSRTVVLVPTSGSDEQPLDLGELLRVLEYVDELRAAAQRP